MRTTRTSIGHLISSLAVWSSIGAALGVPGCLDRPVVPSSPTITARFQRNIRQDGVDKIDLLFMIDNSISMRDKQEILAEAVPDLVERLVHPDCVTADGRPGSTSQNGKCPADMTIDFQPINDIHIGVIDSSLGGHGAEAYRVCEITDDDTSKNDKAHLLTRGASNLDAPFLRWDGGKTTSVERLTATFKDMVLGVGQTGCGWEAQLEAAYRFLIDPEPYASIQLKKDKDGHEIAVPSEDVDKTVLEQRAAFLRPDSMVAVILLSDENDASVQDEGQGFYMLRSTEDNPPLPFLPRGTSACKDDPNSKCCVSCAQTAPDGCMQPDRDPECKRTWTEEDPGGNLRNFQPKVQFGVDLRYPVQRWVDGFKQTTVRKRNGDVVPNPLYSDLTCSGGEGCAPPRSTDRVFVAGIVGVPWQDIAKDPGDLGKGFLSADEIMSNGVWDLVLGDPEASPPKPPKDPFMVESIEPRVNLPPNPVTHEFPQPVDARANASRVNGHEWEATKWRFGDLQYACTFRLKSPQPCTPKDTLCDCYEAEKYKKPLCQNPDTGEYEDTQYYAKAYPGVRELLFLKKLGSQAIVASICPATIAEADKRSPAYGYRPAITTLIDRFRILFNDLCLPRTLAAESHPESPTYGKVPCVVLEAFKAEGDACDCDSVAGRVKASPRALSPAMRSQYDCVCEIEQLEGQDRTDCQTQSRLGGAANGWCYVDPTQGGNAALVARCPASKQRSLRFVGEGQPRIGKEVFIECQEDTAAMREGDDADSPPEPQTVHN